MKIQLVVASGVHQGKTIPVPGGKLAIGRHESCQLRPASPAVSKLHCTITVRDGQLFVTDHGSTNGTFVNDSQISGEVEIQIGDRLRVGPLDFTVDVVPGSKTDNTPLPDSLKALPDTGSKLADVIDGKTIPLSAAAAGGTPLPMPKTPAVAEKTVEEKSEKTVEETKPAAKPKPKPPADPNDPDYLAAMMLAEGDDDSNPVIPDGSTLMELNPNEMTQLQQAAAPAVNAAADKKKAPSAAESSAAANEILKKYMRRPK